MEHFLNAEITNPNIKFVISKKKYGHTALLLLNHTELIHQGISHFIKKNCEWYRSKILIKYIRESKLNNNWQNETNSDLKSPKLKPINWCLPNNLVILKNC